MSAGARRIRVLPTVAIVLVATVPLIVVIVSALSRTWFFPQVVPRNVTARPALELLGRSSTQRALRDGLVLSGLVTAVALVLAWPAARVLAHSARVVRTVSFVLLFLPSVLPPVGLAIGVDVALLRVGLAGRLSGVVLAHLVPSLPYTVGVLTAVFRRYDGRIDDQAAVLGATQWQRFRLVTLPLVGGGVATAAAFTFLVSWSQYLLTLLAGSGRIVTVTMLLYNALSGANAATVSTLALIVLIPALALLGVVRRSTTGMTAP